MPSKKEQICALLKGIETGDPQSVTVVNESKYIQHNPLTRTGNVGLAELFKRLSKTNPHVEIVRVFEDGDYVFAHTDYDFNVVEVGFEVFRFENGLVVEHWDNLQLKPSGPNPSGHTMLDGTTEATDLEKTEENRALIRSFVDEVLVNDQLDRLYHYINSESYIEHNRNMACVNRCRAMPSKENTRRSIACLQREALCYVSPKVLSMEFMYRFTTSSASPTERSWSIGTRSMKSHLAANG